MNRTSKNEVQRSPKHFSQSNDRRVSFADESVATSTDETTRSNSQPFPVRLAAVPGGLPRSSSTARRTSTGGGFSQRTQSYGHDFAPMDSSMTALLGLRPTPSSLASGPAMPPSVCSPRGSPYWVRPPFGGSWSDAFEQPSSETRLFKEAPPADDRDSSAFAWLRSIGVGMMLAAMLTVALTLALTMDLQDSDIRPWPSSPLEGGIESIGSSRVAVPLGPRNVPLGGRTSQAGNVTRHDRRAVKVERRDRALGVQQPRLPQPDANNRTLLSQRCRSHFYSYCHRGRDEVYYSASLRACAPTEADSVQVCNHGANRFTSLESCLASCVNVGDGRPQRHCYEHAVFSSCSWQGNVIVRSLVLQAGRSFPETWWFFDGSRCSRWNFPRGECPLPDGRVFRTRRECDAACARRERGDSDEERRCDAPDAGTCTPRQMRHPYFADMRAGGPARCVVASSGELVVHRCLVGSNRFDSMASCERACSEL
ncbi:uncharacterized protein LOC142588647 [Dermacentor variabilis]|uniref:uncharacterized protein LOC142588647 n=1 Tax=Dermacentor variabilis TaxID=34621 RepID=UPI003F5C1CC6